MGVSIYTYIGPYIEIDSDVELWYEEKDRACPVCKVPQTGNFCNQCGNKIEEIVIEKQFVTTEAYHFKHYVEKFLDSEEVEYISANQIINDKVIFTPDIKEKYGIELERDYNSDAKSISDTWKMDMEDFIYDFSEFINFWKDRGVAITIRYGVVKDVNY